MESNQFNEKKCLQVLQILQCLELKNVSKSPDIAHARKIFKNPGKEEKSKVDDQLTAGLSGNGIYLPVSLGNRRLNKRVKFGYPEAPQA